MPPICHLSKKAEKEAARIYYGENHFRFNEDSRIERFCSMTPTRHLRMIRTVSIDWPDRRACSEFDELGRMAMLESLSIGVDEVAMVERVVQYRHHHNFKKGIENPSVQQQFALWRHNGLSSLMKIKWLKKVKFTKRSGKKTGGPIRDGFLQTQVKPKLLASTRLEDDQRYANHW